MIKKIINIVKNNYYVFIIIVLLGIIFFQTCQNNPPKDNIIKIEGKPYEIVKIKTDTLWKTKTKIKIVKGQDIYKEIIKFDTLKIEKNIDTNKIISNYHNKIIYKDTFNLDNNLGNIYINDTISQNKIVSRYIKADIKEKTITNSTIVKELPKNQIYVGFNTQYSSNNIFIFSPEISLKTKKDNIYSVNVGIDNNFQKYVGISINKKISFKK